MHRSFRWVALLSVALIAVLGVARLTVAQDDTGRADLRIVVVSHGQASDPFWSVVQQGV
jgi:simple sugar transport system substrate-binding protein